VTKTPAPPIFFARSSLNNFTGNETRTFGKSPFISGSFPKKEWMILLTSVEKPVYLLWANENVLADVSSVVPSGFRLLRVHDSERA